MTHPAFAGPFPTHAAVLAAAGALNAVLAWRTGDDLFACVALVLLFWSFATFFAWVRRNARRSRFHWTLERIRACIAYEGDPGPSPRWPTPVAAGTRPADNPSVAPARTEPVMLEWFRRLFRPDGNPAPPEPTPARTASPYRPVERPVTRATAPVPSPRAASAAPPSPPPPSSDDPLGPTGIMSPVNVLSPACPYGVFASPPPPPPSYDPGPSSPDTGAGDFSGSSGSGGDF